ncbi:MAG: hypothetical protein LBI11_06605 [Streptococcaceae bacterium]|jgi:uncharacterized protein YdhG (YjbR/CyaY superfamily)|nr:hypothetical protein [Streptococcaceae bacterium]
MEKAHEFEFYFTDERLAPAIRARMQLTRHLVHELYPDVAERVSYAMPGFYPKKATKATQQLFLLMANKDHLGIYGTQGLEASDLPYALDMGKGSIRVPYDFPEDKFRKLLQFIMKYNMERHGLDLIH